MASSNEVNVSHQISYIGKKVNRAQPSNQMEVFPSSVCRWGGSGLMRGSSLLLDSKIESSHEIDLPTDSHHYYKKLK